MVPNFQAMLEDLHLLKANSYVLMLQSFILNNLHKNMTLTFPLPHVNILPSLLNAALNADLATIDDMSIF